MFKWSTISLLEEFSCISFRLFLASLISSWEEFYQCHFDLTNYQLSLLYLLTDELKKSFV